MGLFGDKLLLRLGANQSSTDHFELFIDKIDKSKSYLLPFSCISLINSQLTVLSEYRRKSLCTSVLEFVAKPEKLRYSTKLVSKFLFELYQKGRNEVYNQFNPLIRVGNSPSVNFAVEKDIVNLVMNFTSTMYEKSNQIDKNKIRIYLLVSVSFFQQDLLPIIKKIDMNNIRNRQRLAKDHVNFSNSIYVRWETSPPFEIGSDLFNHHLNKAVNFDAYL
jgi:hypothetical protein